MHSENDSMHESLSDGIFPDLSYEAPGPAKRSFEGWHHPRKQFVRKFQWCGSLKKLLKNRNSAEGTIKYLGLPGIDLLDLRYIHSAVCEECDVDLLFLGFNTGIAPNSPNSTDLNISLDEVHRLKRVNQKSEIVHDDFKAIGRANSISCKKVLEFGPFDVVNLDLCGGFCTTPPNGLDPDYYTAVAHLLTIQARRATPWVFLLTTRIDEGNVDATVFGKLAEKYLDNLSKHESFNRKSEELLNDTKEVIESGEYSDRTRAIVLLTGISKWLIGLSLSQNPQTIVRLDSVMGYKVRPSAENVDMVSLAYFFTPTTAASTDPIGLSTPVVEMADEGRLALQALSKLGSIKDVDAIFADSKKAEVQLTLIEETEVLLASARYDTGEYRKWLSDVSESFK